MAKFHLKAETIKQKDGKLVAIASEETLDRQGDIIEIDGWDLKNFKKNPQLLWMHNTSFDRSLPIGRADNVRVTDVDGKKKLIFEPVFEDLTEFGRTVSRFFKDGWLNAFSVGFDPIEAESKSDGGYRFKKQELLEISAVTVPALQTALVIQRSKDAGLNMKAVDAILGKTDPADVDGVMVDKGVIPFRETETAPESEVWDPDAEIKVAEISDLKQMCAWVDGENKEDKSGYKFPHHKAGTGYKVVWRAVSQAMADLVGRKGTEVPEEDRKGIYNHLKKHYDQYNKEVPEFRDYQPSETRTYWIDGVPMSVIDPESPVIRTNRRLRKMLQLMVGEIRSYKKQTVEASAKREDNNKELVETLEIITAGFENAEKKLTREGGD